MKMQSVLGAVLAASIMTVGTIVAVAAEPDTSAYSFRVGKEGRPADTVPYAGINYEGGEQGDTSAYGFRAGKADRPDDGSSYAGVNYEGGEQGDTSAYSFRTGRAGKPWAAAE